MSQQMRHETSEQATAANQFILGHHTRSRISRFLREMPSSVVLKSVDPIAALEQGSDIDILSLNCPGTIATMKAHLGEPLLSVRFGHFYEWGHIDIMPNINMQGVVLLKAADAFIGTTVNDEGIRIARPTVNAIIGWFDPIVGGGFFKESSTEAIQTALDREPEVLSAMLMALFGAPAGSWLFSLAKEKAPYKALAKRAKLARALIARQFRKEPQKLVARIFVHAVLELRLRLTPPVPWISIFVPDSISKGEVRNLFSGLKLCVPHSHEIVEPLAHDNSPVPYSLAWLLWYWRLIVHKRGKLVLVYSIRSAEERNSSFGRQRLLFSVLRAKVQPSPDFLLFWNGAGPTRSTATDSNGLLLSALFAGRLHRFDGAHNERAESLRRFINGQIQARGRLAEYTCYDRWQ